MERHAPRIRVTFPSTVDSDTITHIVLECYDDVSSLMTDALARYLTIEGEDDLTRIVFGVLEVLGPTVPTEVLGLLGRRFRTVGSRAPRSTES